MKILSIKLGREKIEIWQVFIFIFLLLMFFVCVFLGYGFISSAHSNVDVQEVEETEELGIITDFSKISSDNYNNTKLNEYYKNYKRLISDNEGVLKL
ncbi:MAG: hypothetical protein K6E99_02875, partial [Bacilli bacterium]|nr:hypothetical protein [Bacilli bacterium]